MSENQLTTIEGGNGLSPLAKAGKIADAALTQSAFELYRSDLSPNTLKRHDASLRLYLRYLREAIGLYPESDPAPDLAGNPFAWRDTTAGIVMGFREWLLKLGYASGSIGVHLSCIRTYCAISASAGAIDERDALRISILRASSGMRAKRRDKNREVKRRGHKKENWIRLTRADVDRIMTVEFPNEAETARARMIVMILDELGIRVGELANLTVSDLDGDILHVYREKTDLNQLLRCSPALVTSIQTWLVHDPDRMGHLVKHLGQDGTVGSKCDGLSIRRIQQIIEDLGTAAGIQGHLSPHDLRHNWATRAGKHNDIHILMQAGGWSSIAMPLRYMDADKIANDQLKMN
jgi:integrase